MTDTQSDMGEPRSAWRGRWLLLTLLLIGWGVDLHFDIHQRDALTWMDEYQYFGFARALASGQMGLGDFELPSVFPLLIAPVSQVAASWGASTSFAAALWTNAVAVAVLVLALAMIRRSLRLSAPTVALAAVVVASPLMLGLSRSMYSEFTLAAVATLHFAVWLRTDGFSSRGWTSAWGLLLGLGVMLKMTYPLFVVGPWLAQVALLLRRRAWRGLATLLGVTCAAAAGVLLLQTTVFGRSFDYYLNLGNTLFPIMDLIGPVEIFSAESLVYYGGVLVKLGLFVVTPMAVVAIALAWRQPRGKKPAAFGDLLLWLWLLTPMVALTFIATKEPRHLAPALPAAALLLARAIDHLREPALRRKLWLATLAAAAAQYGLATLGFMLCPYFMDRPTYAGQIKAAMFNADPQRDDYLALFERGATQSQMLLRWQYNRNVAMTGFDANTSLALVWAMIPGTAIDLDALADPLLKPLDLPATRFEDVLYYAAFSSYNLRCGWPKIYHALDAATAAAQADFLIVGEGARHEVTAAFPTHEIVASLGDARRVVWLLRHRDFGQEPYRLTYARQFLQAHPNAAATLLNTILFDMTAARVLDLPPQDPLVLAALMPPDYRPTTDRRPLYWLTGGWSVDALVRPVYEQLIARWPSASARTGSGMMDAASAGSQPTR